MSKTFSISPSGLTAFFSCPARYRYQQEWKPLRLSAELQDGIDTHAALAGEKNPATLNERSAFFYRNLKAMAEPYTVLQTEQRQVVEFHGVRLVRVIDVKARLGREGIIVDYKTAKSNWTRGPDGGYPKGQGFQAAAYLIPPTDKRDLKPYRTWPTLIAFLVASQGGRHLTVSYRRVPADSKNLAEAIDTVKGATVFPKNRGFNCGYCPFDALCYNVKGWEDKYQRRVKDEPVEETAE